jgi:uncharacterized protein (DUF433 family)
MRVITVREQLAARNARIVAVCQAGATLAEIAADYGITATRVGQILAEAGLTRHLRRVRRREQLLAVVRDLAPGRTVRRVVELMGLSKGVVYNLAREAGVRFRRQPPPGRLTEDQVRELLAAFDAGAGTDVLAKRFGVDRHYVNVLLNRHGRSVRSRDYERLLACLPAEIRDAAAAAGLDPFEFIVRELRAGRI